MRSIELFAHFTAIWGYKWASCMNDKNVNKLALRHWQQVLDELMPDQIENACAKSRSILDWPPSIAQFKKLALDIKSAEQEFYLAKDNDPESQFRNLLDNWSWKTFAPEKLKREFYAKYDIETQKLLNNSENCSLNRLEQYQS